MSIESKIQQIAENKRLIFDKLSQHLQSEITPEDIIEWLCEEQAFSPIANNNGEVYTTNDGKILIL